VLAQPNIELFSKNYRNLKGENFEDRRELTIKLYLQNI